MCTRLRLLLLILFQWIPLALAQGEPPWTWAGMEILGNHRVPRSAIEKLIPIPVGESYHLGDAPFWSDACSHVREVFDFASVDCGDRPLRVFDGRKAYLIVDIVEKGRERRLMFRDPPSGTIPFRSLEMLEIIEELDSKTMKAAMAGHAYSESGETGHLTYVDPAGQNEDVSPLVQRLALLVPHHRDNLLEILRREKSPDHRRTAANLLNWAGGDIEETLRRSIPLLDDPDPGVRNNLSRFMIHFAGQVGSKRLRRRLIDAFLVQIERPSHGDRNKGLYNLLEIARAWPEDLAYLRSRGHEPIRYLAENSILFNVKGAAEELLVLLGASGRA